MRFPNPIRWLKLQNRREDRRRLNCQRQIRHAIAMTERAIEDLDRLRWNTPAAVAWVEMTRRIWRWRAMLDRLKVELELETAGMIPPLVPKQEGN